jgi:hypothetical protein
VEISIEQKHKAQGEGKLKAVHKNASIIYSKVVIVAVIVFIVVIVVVAMVVVVSVA